MNELGPNPIVNCYAMLFLGILIGCSKFFNQSQCSNPALHTITLKVIFKGWAADSY